MRTRLAVPADSAAIAHIYNQGIEDRVATFETTPRRPEDIQKWFGGNHSVIVVEDESGIIAFASTSTYRPRGCRRIFGLCRAFRTGHGAGRLAMQALIREAENAGLWKLVSRIFVENTASRRLMLSLGFRDTVIVELLLHANLGLSR